MYSIKNILLVGFGGMAGSILRYVVGMFFSTKQTSAFPMGTFTINMVGCFLIGCILGLALQQKNLIDSNNLKLILATGFCGGFTTFSAFGNESLQLMRQNNWTIFFIYIGLSILLGIAATAFGYYVAQKINLF